MRTRKAGGVGSVLGKDVSLEGAGGAEGRIERHGRMENPT